MWVPVNNLLNHTGKVVTEMANTHGLLVVPTEQITLGQVFEDGGSGVDHIDHMFANDVHNCQVDVVGKPVVY